MDYQVLAGKSVSPADQFELLTMAMGELIDGKEAKFRMVAKGLLGPDSAPGSAVEGGQTDPLAGVPRRCVVTCGIICEPHGRVPARVFIGADSVTSGEFPQRPRVRVPV